MTPEDFDEALRELWDRETDKWPDGAKSADIENALLDEASELLGLVDIDVRGLAAGALHRVGAELRRTRRKSMRENIEYLLDGFAGNGVYMDPMLSLAYPLGTPDGQVKTLRNWTERDFVTSVQMAYRKASESVAAARAYDETIERAIHDMHARGVDRFGG